MNILKALFKKKEEKDCCNLEIVEVSNEKDCCGVEIIEISTEDKCCTANDNKE